MNWSAGFAARLAAVRARIAAACARAGRPATDVELLAVSKTRPAADVALAMAAGLGTFGENRVQELAVKATDPAVAGATWHLIGSLQTNKCKALLAVPGLELVHSLDRPKLAERLNEVCAAAGRVLGVLVQIDATGEESKHGVVPERAMELARTVVRDCPALRLAGVMAMGPAVGDPVPVFALVAAEHERLRDALGLPLPVRSLGMTGDLEQAVAAGSTLVRVGTALFGARGMPG